MKAPQSRTVRVFLSSTFRDFAPERDLLMRKVFPELRRKCRERQVELVDVDLRWSITKEETRQGKLMPICLAEIDRSRPWFMGFIGERYGWIPDRDQYDLSLLVEQPWLEKHRGGKSTTELEMLHGVLNNPAMQGRAFFYFRDPKWSRRQGDPYLSEGPTEKAWLEALKARIRRSGYPVVEDYPNPEALAERVREDLWRQIDAAYPEAEVPDALTLERGRHEAYGGARRRLYLGGERYLATLDEALRARGGQPVLVRGEAGGGKSALLANWTAAWSRRHPRAAVVLHHLGCGADTADTVRLAVRLMQEIGRLTGDAFRPESDPERQVERLPEWLALGSAWAQRTRRQLVLVLDGLENLSERRDLRWLPAQLPPRVRLVASCRDGEVLEAARERLTWQEVKVRPFSKKRRSWFIRHYLGMFHKALTPAQSRRLQSHPLSGNPLFLKTALEELRVFGVPDELERRLGQLLSPPPGKGLGEEPAVVDVFQHVLARMEADLGRGLVQRAMEAIWASRAGLHQDELLAIAKLPPARWAAIQNALDESLYEAAGRICFSHAYLRKAVEGRYGLVGRRARGAHQRLAEWFDKQEVDARVAEELPWQWEQAGKKELLKAALVGPQLFLAMRERNSHELLGYWLRLGEDFREEYQPESQVWKAYDEDKPGALAALHEFLWNGQIITQDFCRTLISSLDPWNLTKELAACSLQFFANHQPGGTRRVKTSDGVYEAHVMGSWGFSMTNKMQLPDVSNLHHRQVAQWHFPAYKMAACLRQQDHFFVSADYSEGTLANWMPIPAMIRGRNKMDFYLQFSFFRPGQPKAARGAVWMPIPEWFVRGLKQDLPLLEAAISQVQMRKDGMYYLPGIKTPEDNPVEFESEEMVEAIAFEKTCYPLLTAGNFGIYSAYCTYRDAGACIEMPEALIQSLVEGQLQLSANDRK